MVHTNLFSLQMLIWWTKYFILPMKKSLLPVESYLFAISGSAIRMFLWSFLCIYSHRFGRIQTVRILLFQLSISPSSSFLYLPWLTFNAPLWLFWAKLIGFQFLVLVCDRICTIIALYSWIILVDSVLCRSCHQSKLKLILGLPF